jgi:hypothetical protein
MPCFLKSPFSSATQIDPDVALMELRPTRILSWAAELGGDSKHDRRNTVERLRANCSRFIKTSGEHSTDEIRLGLCLQTVATLLESLCKRQEFSIYYKEAPVENAMVCIVQHGFNRIDLA